MNLSFSKLPLHFYLHPDVTFVARALLGKVIISEIGDERTSGIIIETEAYAGVSDKASHAYGGRFTERTKTLYEKGGITYVYLCYGIHSLLNVVTGKKGIPHGVLLRALYPLEGIKLMLRRRKKKNIDSTLCGGPAMLTQALGVVGKHNGLSLHRHPLWLVEGISIRETDVEASCRIGIDYAEEDALLPWRFCIKNVPYSFGKALE